MTGLVMVLALQGMVMANNGALSYEQAYQEAEKSGRPLIVLVGAEWCAGCRVMKQDTMPAMERSGGLKNVSYAIVDMDERPELARQLSKGGSIPQLIMFSRSADGWQRTQLTGAASPELIRELIDRGLGAHIALKPTIAANSKN